MIWTLLVLFITPRVNSGQWDENRVQNFLIIWWKSSSSPLDDYCYNEPHCGEQLEVFLFDFEQTGLI